MCAVLRGVKLWGGDGEHSDLVPKNETITVLLNPAAEKCSQVFHSIHKTHNTRYYTGETVHLWVTIQVQDLYFCH